ncbi:hypothetical protein CDL15_Pgr029124 [Punica granatum]|nr:hypothetical protein CDL15_Pgr029124 [Punica granatum]
MVTSRGALDTAGTSSLSCDTAADDSISCCGLAKFIDKLRIKRKRRLALMLRGGQRCTTSSQNSLQCRYDPLSYSLNFDTRSGSGSLLDDEDYYQFYAFSSRFAANPAGSGSCTSLGN